MSGEAFRQIQIDLTRDQAFELSRVLDNANPMPELSGYYEIVYDESRPISDRTQLMLYFPIGCAEALLQTELLLEAMGMGDATLTETKIASRDYLQAYKEHYRSLLVSPRILIVPSWEQDSEEVQQTLRELDGRRALFLDPGLAFGTGRHPTTQLCLRYIEAHLNGGRVLDAGCGSGILSLAALAFGAHQVLAFDVDGNALTALKQNAALNPGIESGRLTALQGGFELPEVRAWHGDVIFANLTARIIEANLDLMLAMESPRIVLSGILAEDGDRVASLFLPAYRKARREDQDDWVLLELLRNS